MTDHDLTALDKARHIKLLALDVDGVLTDGRLYFGAEGEQLKVFNSRDGQGIKMLIASGVDIAIITARETPALEQRAADLGIQYLYQGREDKLNALRELLVDIDLAPQQVAYLGDDLPDLPVILKAGLGMSVANGYDFVKQHSDWCSLAEGGHGAVREACDFIMSAQGNLERALAHYLEDTE